MYIDKDRFCDGCACDLPQPERGNTVVLNAATYDLCKICYKKLLDFFNKEITV